jgi:hypothetical protein
MFKNLCLVVVFSLNLPGKLAQKLQQDGQFQIMPMGVLTPGQDWTTFILAGSHS